MCSYWSLVLLAVALDQFSPLQASSLACGKEDLIGTTKPKRLKSWRARRKYPHNMDCTYRISVGEGYGILVTVTKIDTQPGHDFLQIFDGNASHRKRRIAKLSGQDSDLKYKSTGTIMTITFTTDDRVAYRGFSLTYQKVPCKSCKSGSFDDGETKKSGGGIVKWFNNLDLGKKLAVVCGSLFPLILIILIVAMIRMAKSDKPPRARTCPDRSKSLDLQSGPPSVRHPSQPHPPTSLFPCSQGDPRMSSPVPASPFVYPHVPYSAQPMPVEQQMPSAPQAPADPQTSAGKEAITVNKNITVNIN